MAGRKPAVMNGREFAVLKLLWEHGPLTVRELRAHLIADEEIPYTTVLSLVQLMEKKGYLAHERQGKTYVYSARIERQETTGRVLEDFVDRFFDGSPEALVLGLAESEAISPALWKKLQAEISTRKKR